MTLRDQNFVTGIGETAYARGLTKSACEHRTTQHK